MSADTVETVETLMALLVCKIANLYSLNCLFDRDGDAEIHTFMLFSSASPDEWIYHKEKQLMLLSHLEYIVYKICIFSVHIVL